MKRWFVALAAFGVLATSAFVVAVPLVTADEVRCADGSVGEWRGKHLLCVHDDEPPPPGVDPRRRPTLDELRQRRLAPHPRKGAPANEGEPEVAETTRTESGSGYRIRCVGDGISGPRVQAVYAVATDQSDRSTGAVPLIREYAADADLRINRSAAAHGEGRRIRFVTEPLPGGECQIEVRVVYLSPTGDDTFANTRSELRAQGLSRTDRKYLVWVDAAVGICGLGELYQSDRPSEDNPNNRGPMYARTDAPCWGYAETHELLHTLGAVQNTAPNATTRGHCVQKNDSMCYADASGVTLSQDCPTHPAQWVDCNLDDYFAPKPPPNSYLATRWNLATSAFLHPDVAPPPPPTVTVSVPDHMFAGNTVTAKASITVPEGQTATITWASSRSDCRFGSPNQATTSFTCPATAAGSVELSAFVVDSDGMAASSVGTIRLAVPAAPRTTALSAALSPTAVVFGDALRVSGRLIDAATGAGIAGMPVTAYSLVNGTTEYRTKATGVTDANGKIALSFRPSASAKVLMIAASTSTWQQAQSPERAMTVAYAVTAGPASTTVSRGKSVTITAKVLPADGGIPVVLRQTTSSGTTTVASARLSAGGDARLTFTPARGKSTLRVVVPATALRAPGRSASLQLTVN